MSRKAKRLLAVVSAAAVIPIIHGGSSPAQAAPATFSSTVVNMAGSNCTDVPASNPDNGVQLILWSCHGGANQNFTFVPVSGTTNQYNIRTLTSGSCVDIYGASTADNASVIQWTCHSGDNQRFRLEPVNVSGVDKTFNVVAVHSGKCVAPAGGATGNNTGLVQLPCSTTSVRVWRLPGYASDGGGNTFTNPIKTRGPDPYMTHYNGYYYLVTTTWNSTITMRRSRTLAGIATAPDTVVYNLSGHPTACCNMWAPEIHLLNGPNGLRWYLYFTAGQNVPNYLPTQRIHVLESAGADPMGPYSFKASMLDPSANNTWELDGSILQLNGRLYLLGTFYNGSQPNFIRPLSNPWTASGTRRILSTPTYSWETVGGAVNEGAEVLQRNGRTFIVFSASHCSTPEYKLGLLTYNGGDPLNSSSWVKKSSPIFWRNDAAGVYGPGHGNFFKSPDGTEDWMTYHANSSVNGGCDMNRSTRAQKFTWNADGTPNLGRPVAAGTALPAPSGEPTF